jgi:hypothetical protein
MDRKQDHEVASILTMVRLCQNYQVLPGAGGLLDQDSYYVFLMACVSMYDQERADRDKSSATTSKLGR